MRELIQPALKIVARTGLFLSVVAWVVSQWWYVELSTPDETLTLFAQSWQLIGPSYPPIWRLIVCTYEDPDPSLLELRLFLYPITFRHHLIVSTFTIFNAALWWFYRKPNEVTPCEN